MPYTVELSRNNPTFLVFLIDQSSLMAEPFAARPEIPKARGVAGGINRLLQNLILKCAKSHGIRDYFHVAVIGYIPCARKSAFAGWLSATPICARPKPMTSSGVWASV
jgi:hypothetical protein